VIAAGLTYSLIGSLYMRQNDEILGRDMDEILGRDMFVVDFAHSVSGSNVVSQARVRQEIGGIPWT